MGRVLRQLPKIFLNETRIHSMDSIVKEERRPQVEPDKLNDCFQIDWVMKSNFTLESLKNLRKAIVRNR